MKVLAIDTSTNTATVALMEDDRLICEYSINNRLTHSQKLLSQLESVLKISGENLASVGLISICIGPGSFTGIRIGVAAAKAISQVWNIPMVEVSSLELAARNFDCFDGSVIGIIDAQKDNLYYNIFEFDQRSAEIIKENTDSVIGVDDLIEKVKLIDGKKIFVGEGLLKAKDRLKTLAQEDKNVFLAGSDKNINKAGSLAKAGLIRHRNGESKNYFEVEPKYIRKPQAQLQMEEKEKQKIYK